MNSTQTARSPRRRYLAAAVATAALVLGTMAVAQQSASAATPSNDSFANAAQLTGTSVTVTGSNVDATTETGEPTTTSWADDLGATVWYRWTAPASATFEVSLAGSDYDTTLSVFTGSSVSSLSRITTDDDDAFQHGQSSVGFTAAAGTTYYFQLGGYQDSSSADSGTIHLTLGQAALSGTVSFPTGSGDSPLSGCLALYADPNGDPVASGCASADYGGSGLYAIGPVSAGQYYVAFGDADDPVFYPTTEGSNPVSVTIPAAGCTTTGVNVVLTEGTVSISPPTGKSCPLSPACQTATSSVASATAALAADKGTLVRDQKGLAKLKKKLKKAKKAHRAAAVKKLEKKLKKAKKSEKKAASAVSNAAKSLGTANAAVASSC